MEFKPCKCGSGLFYMRQRICGEGDFYINADGSEADNEVLYASVNHKDKWKFYRCAECGKKAERVD